MYEEKIIDVNYIECDEKPDKDNNTSGNVTINADPLSTLFHEAVSGICGIVNNVTTSIKEYNICRQQEQTKREEIRAYLKMGLEQIQSQKEIMMKQLEFRHEADMAFIQHEHEVTMKLIDSSISVIDSAVETAKETKDFSVVIELMKYSGELADMRSKVNLQLMECTGSNTSASAIGCSLPKGYLK